MVELKVNMRQQNDTTYQMLNGIRKGEHTHEDVETIQGRLVSNGDVDLSAAPFDTALRLYPRTASVDEYRVRGNFRGCIILRIFTGFIFTVVNHVYFIPYIQY